MLPPEVIPVSEFTVASVIEVIGESTESWEDAVNNAVEAAAKTVQHITGVEVLNLTAASAVTRPISTSPVRWMIRCGRSRSPR